MVIVGTEWRKWWRKGLFRSSLNFNRVVKGVNGASVISIHYCYTAVLTEANVEHCNSRNTCEHVSRTVLDR